MVTLNLYQTKITASDYNPSIDDSITVTVTLLDFNGNAVTGTNATITVNQGYFTKYTRNSTDTAISGTSTKSYNGTTGNNGSFTMTYKCSEWGLATFSANNIKTQINTKGNRTLTLRDGWLLRYNDTMASLEVNFTWTSNVNSGDWIGPLTLTTDVPVSCCPIGERVVSATSHKDMYVQINPNGDIYYRNISGSTLSKPSIGCNLCWLI